MANIVLSANSNWSALSIGASDNVYLNGFTANIDVASITCALVKACASNGTTMTAGTITLANDTTTINANLIAGTVALVSLTSSKILTINGNVTGGTATNAYGINIDSGATLSVYGTVTGGSAASAHGLRNVGGTVAACTSAVGGSNSSGAYGVVQYMSGISTTIGTATSGTAANCFGASVSTGTMTITTANGATSAYAVYANGGTLNVITANGGLASACYGIYITGSCNATIGTVNGSTTANCSAVYIAGSSACTVNITTANGGSASGAYGAYIANGSLATVTIGDVYGGSGYGSYGLSMLAGDVTVTNATGGTAGSVYGIFQQGGSLQVTNAYGGTIYSAAGVCTNTTGACSIGTTTGGVGYGTLVGTVAGDVIIGTANGGDTSTGYGVQIQGGNTTITNVNGGSAASCYGCLVAANSPTVSIGTASGGSANDTCGLCVNAPGASATVTLAVGGSYAGSAGVRINAGSAVIGVAKGGSVAGAAGVVTLAGDTTINGVDLTGAGHPIGGGTIKIADGVRLSYRTTYGNTRKWYGADLMPAGENVVAGTAYGAGDYTAAYPTSETSYNAGYEAGAAAGEESQSITDKAAIRAVGLDHIDGGTIILGLEGTGLNASTLTQAIADLKTEVLAMIDPMATKIAAVFVAPVKAFSPMISAERIQLVQYGDYHLAMGRELHWDNPSGSWHGGDLTGCAVQFAITDEQGSPILRKTGAVVTAIGRQRVICELDSADTALLTSEGAVYSFEVAVASDGNFEPIILGTLVNHTGTLTPNAA